MTTSIWHPMVYQCGHEGNVIMSENDQPFSKAWQSFSVPC